LNFAIPLAEEQQRRDWVNDPLKPYCLRWRVVMDP
jgi:hypothetical protein